MKILTVTRGRVPRMKCHALRIPGTEHHFIFHNDKQRNRAMRSLGLPRQRCHVSHTRPGQTGAAKNRQWAERNLTDDGEWFVSLDDNVHELTWLPEPWYHEERVDLSGQPSSFWRELYATPCPPSKVRMVLEDTMQRCIDTGTVLGGHAIENNYYFRQRKWQEFGYVRTSCAVVQNVGLPWYYWPGNMLEDFTRTVDVVARYGCVVVNRFLKAEKVPFEAGGIGPFEARLPSLVAISDELMKRYPGLLRRNKGQDYQLTFKLRSRRTVDMWRREHGYL